LCLLNVLEPALVGINGVDAQPDGLDPALLELRLQPRDVAELGGAHRREVPRVREEDAPLGAQPPLVEVDAALRALGAEVGCGVSQSQRHVVSPFVGVVISRRRAQLSRWCGVRACATSRATASTGSPARIVRISSSLRAAQNWRKLSPARRSARYTRSSRSMAAGTSVAAVR